MKAKAGLVKAILAYFEQIFNRKTIKGFAERVRAFEDLPQPVQEALHPHLDPAEALQLILLAPAQSVLATSAPVEGWWPKKFLPWQITPDQTLLLTPARLLVASIAHPLDTARSVPPPAEGEAAPEKPEVTAIPLGDILFIESGTVLLSAWLDLAWVRQGCLERRRVHFNAVGAPLFEDLCRRIRAGGRIQAAPPGGAAVERALLDELPYKFKSLIPRRLLLQGEPVRALVYRPALWSRGPLPFRRPPKAVQPRLAALRSDRYLILAEEDLSPDGTAYGLIARFIALDCVRRAGVQETPSGLELTLSLAHHGVEHQLRLPFPAAERRKLEELLEFAPPE